MCDITTFKLKGYEWLSNMAFVDILYDGTTYPSVENFYQAMKFKRGWTFEASAKRRNVRLELSRMNPYEAKKFSKFNQMTSKIFDCEKLNIMKFGLLQKFNQEPFKSKLLSTGDCRIQEGNYWGDVYWGVDLKTGIGENNLGRLIMEIRSELRLNLTGECDE